MTDRQAFGAFVAFEVLTWGVALAAFSAATAWPFHDCFVAANLTTCFVNLLFSFSMLLRIR